MGEIAALRESLGLLQIGHDHKATLLASCEIALGERDEKISTLQSELAAAKESAKERLSALADDADRQLAQAMAIVRKQGDELKEARANLAAAREELARAKPALIKAWEIFFTRSFSQDPIGRAEARYAREIAHKGEEG